MASSQAALIRYMRTFKSLPVKQVVNEIENGRDIPTQAVVMLPGDAHADNAYRKKLIDAGLVAVVLKHLNRCQDEKFLNILSETDGDLAFPSVWVNLLLNMVAKGNLPPRQLDKTRMQIASNIGPLIKCMSNDKKREFFQDNQAWHQTICFFIALLQNLVLTPETIPILLENKRLMHVVIRSMFWETHRPDIVLESRAYGIFILRGSFALMRSSASEVVKEMCDVQQDKAGQFTNEGRNRLETISKVSIVASDYNESDSEQVFFGDGLIDLLKSSDYEDHDSLLYILQQFVLANIISQRLINGIIEYGTDNIHSYSNAESVILTLYNMMIPTSGGGSERTPDDDRFKVAIDAGVFEMCLGLLVKYGANQPGGNRMMEVMGGLFRGATAVSLLRNSSKAISERNNEIMKAVRNTMQRVNRNSESMELVRLVESILKINPGGSGSKSGRVWCRRCLTVLEHDEIKSCNGCKRAIYCSRECQVDDWKHGGHKMDCKSMATSDLQVEQRGGSKRDVKRAQSHEANVSMAGNKVFFDNLSSVIMQAVFHDYDILDCIVMIDLCDAPPSIEVMLSSAFLANEMSTDYDNYDHMQRIIARNRENGALTVACVSIGLYENIANEANAPRAILLKTFPSMSAPMGSWTAAQENAKQSLGFSLDEMHDDEIDEIMHDLKRAKC